MNELLHIGLMVGIERKLRAASSEAQRRYWQHLLECYCRRLNL